MVKNIKIYSLLAVLCGQALLENVAIATGTQASSWIKTEVIEDLGGQPIESYLPVNKKTQEKMKKRFYNRLSTKLVNAHFPVVTTSMTVGKVMPEEATDINYQVTMRPIFIVGYDPVSINWLKTNQALLAEKKAIGLVVNVENNEQMEALQKIVGIDVMMQPTPGDRLSEHLKIKHYPFYMDNQGVMR